MKLFFNTAFCILCMLFSGLLSAHSEPDNNSNLTNICPLPPPEVLEITQITHNSATLQWSAVPDASLYKVTVENLTNGGIMPAQYTSATNLTIGGLQPNTTYRFGVSATRCNTPPPIPDTNFGIPIKKDATTRSIIIDELITGINGCSLTPRNLPISIDNINIPYVQTGSTDISFYQTEISGTTQRGEFSCRFNIAVPCPEVGLFHVSMISSAGMNISECSNSCGMVSFMKGDDVLFSLSNTYSSNLIPPTHKIKITFYEGYVTSWKDNQSTTCSVDMTSPCGGINPGPSGDDETSGSSEANSKLPNVKLAPNPTSQYTDLSMDIVEPEMLQISLHDMLGRKISVFKSDELVPAGTFNHRIELAHLPPGMYFVNIQTKAGIKTEVLVKQ